MAKKATIQQIPTSKAHTESVSASEDRTSMVLDRLIQLGDRLKRSEAEREILEQDMAECRRAILEMEDRSVSMEKAYLSIEHKISRNSGENEATTAIKEQQEKLGVDLEALRADRQELEARLESTEALTQNFDTRLSDFVAEAARITKRIDKIDQDKTRMLRKMERMEQIAIETREALQAKALVLLTDQNIAARSALPQQPALESGEKTAASLAALSSSPYNDRIAQEDLPPPLPWYRRSAGAQAAIAILCLAMGVIIGAMIFWLSRNPDVFVDIRPTIERTSAVRGDEATSVPVQTSAANDDAALPEAGSDITVADNVSYNVFEDRNDQVLAAAFEQDQEGLAAALNEIAPTAFTEGEDEATPAEEGAYSVDGNDTPVSENEMARDPALSDEVRAVEDMAYQGSGEAQHDLGALYVAGQGGVTVDYTRAAFWFGKAAANNIANAQYNLGVLYHQGLGTDADVNRAIELYQDAAKHGHPEAQYNLGIAHVEGIGVDYDPNLAASYFESASTGGIPEAAYNLGLIYENGLLGTPDRETALEWYMKAAQAGNPEAKIAVEQLGADISQMEPAAGDILNQPIEPIDLTLTPSVDRKVITALQENLSDVGLYAGPVDGQYRDALSDAIRAYERLEGLDVTGMPSSQLLVRMENNSSAQ